MVYFHALHKYCFFLVTMQFNTGILFLSEKTQKSPDWTSSSASLGYIPGGPAVFLCFLDEVQVIFAVMVQKAEC